MKSYEKVCYIVEKTCGVCIIVLVSIQLLGVWENALDVVEPLLGVLSLMRGFQLWNHNKLHASSYFFTAIFIFVICFYVLNFK